MEFFSIGSMLGLQSGLTQISAQQSPGQICPVFNISEVAVLGGTLIGEFDVNSWDLLPEEMTISFVGIDWDCYRSTPKTRVGTNGIERTTQYVPKIMRELTKSYGRPIYFISCSNAKFLKIQDQLNTELVDVYHKESDNYPTTGWAIKDIMEKIGELAEIKIECDLPQLYTGNISQQYEPRTSLLQFLQSLIPGIVETIWLATNDKLTISFIDPAGSPSQIAYPTNIAGYEITEVDIPPYDAYEITGGMGKPDKTRYYDIEVTEPVEREDSREKTTSFGGQSATLTITTTYMPDQFGNPFYTISEEEIVTGEIWRDAYGDYSNDITLQETETTFQTEFTDPWVYAKARITHKTRAISGYINYYYPGYLGTGYGRQFFLLNTLEMLDRETLLARISGGEASYTDVLISAYQAWTDNYEIRDELWEYTSEEDADERWFEGSLQNNTVSVSRKVVYFTYAGETSPLFDILTPIDRVMASIIADIGSKGLSPTSIAIFTTMQDLEVHTKTIEPDAMGTYTFRRIATTFDPATGATTTQTDEETIGSDQIPSAPKELRRQRLRYREGDFGEKKLIYPMTAGISSCNWEDLEIWTAFVQNKNIESRVSRNWEHVPYPILPGQTFNGCKVVGFSVIESASGGYDIGLNTKGFIASDENGFGGS